MSKLLCSLTLQYYIYISTWHHVFFRCLHTFMYVLSRLLYMIFCVFHAGVCTALCDSDDVCLATEAKCQPSEGGCYIECRKDTYCVEGQYCKDSKFCASLYGKSCADSVSVLRVCSAELVGSFWGLLYNDWLHVLMFLTVWVWHWLLMWGWW